MDFSARAAAFGFLFAHPVAVLAVAGAVAVAAGFAEPSKNARTITLAALGLGAVLLLFAVMLTRAPIGASADLDRPGWPAVLVGGGTGLGLALLLVDAYRWSTVPLPEAGTADRMGSQIFGSWVLPFEVLSVLLLSALVGAIVLSRPDIGRRSDGSPQARRPAGPPPGRRPVSSAQGGRPAGSVREDRR